MYLEFYNLREYPFSIGCDERFYYQSSVHAEALANMLYTFQQRKGMVLISGEVGAGKTFVGHMLISHLGPSCEAVMLRHPPQSGKQLFRAVAAAVGIRPAHEVDKLDLVDELHEHLMRMFQRGRLVALIIDECQDLSANALEEIRLLWNWEENGQRLMQILLIGQPELRERLLEPKWESLRQRIVLSYHLDHLSAADTQDYIHHRLKIAGGESKSLAEFTPQALAQIYGATNGIPRLINVLCDNALLVSFARGKHQVDHLVISEVLRDMTCWGLHTVAGDLEPLVQANTRSGGV
ncbi:MAG: AAA family ATPase [Planctomycetaceae bacterium]|nr:AAA family ATPase [Planctomycetaceae bacterium]